jgi:hypothetical protein
VDIISTTFEIYEVITVKLSTGWGGGRMILTSSSFKRSSITCLDLLTGDHVMILILVK